MRTRILQSTKAGATGSSAAAGSGASGTSSGSGGPGDRSSSGSVGHTLERRKNSFLDGTLRRSFKTGSLKKQRVEEEQMLEMFIKEETSATRTSILEKWTRLQGLPQYQAMIKYMTIIKEWPGYGSTLFDVEVREGFIIYTEKLIFFGVQFPLVPLLREKQRPMSPLTILELYMTLSRSLIARFLFNSFTFYIHINENLAQEYVPMRVFPSTV